GVAHLVLPDEVQTQPSDAPAAVPDGRLSDRKIRPDEDDLARAAELIAGDEVRQLAERLQAPVLTTYKGKGLIPDDHPLGAGVLGRSGTPVASWLMNESDLLIVVGASFANHTGVAAYKPIVQIDDDPAAIGRFHAVAQLVLADARLALTALAGLLDAV